MLNANLFKKLVLRASIVFVALFTLVKISSTRENYAKNDNGSEANLNGGTITGAVRFPEEYPEREKITTTKDQQICGAFQYSEVFVVSEENHGLQNVVIFLENIKNDKKAGEGFTATLNQKGCRYIPHVQAVPVGTELEILNNDGILHNVHAYQDGLDPKNTVFNKAQPRFLKKIKQTLDKPGIYYFKCDVHDHMSAYILVMDHPYYAVTDESGGFTITNVPAGTYKIQAWHEALGTLEKSVTVESGATAEVKFDILPNE
ncbi:MAG: carboxypeptidase regulatory-like domain-containing protein [bacterium]